MPSREEVNGVMAAPHLKPEVLVVWQTHGEPGEPNTTYYSVTERRLATRENLPPGASVETYTPDRHTELQHDLAIPRATDGDPYGADWLRYAQFQRKARISFLERERRMVEAV